MLAADTQTAVSTLDHHQYGAAGQGVLSHWLIRYNHSVAAAKHFQAICHCANFDDAGYVDFLTSEVELEEGGVSTMCDSLLPAMSPSSLAADVSHADSSNARDCNVSAGEVIRPARIPS